MPCPLDVISPDPITRLVAFSFAIVITSTYIMYVQDPSKFVAAAAPAATADSGSAPAAAAAEEKKEEPAEESDDDMGFSLFD